MKALIPFVLLGFTACATASPADAKRSAAINQVAVVHGLRVRPIAVLEDSRCPANVQCVWAGRLIVRVVVNGGTWREQRDLELGKPQAIADGTLTVVAASPTKRAPGRVDSRAYRFTFAFEGGL